MPVKGGDTHMRKHLTVSSKLVVQGGGTVMTSTGEVPVIFVPDMGEGVEHWMEFLAMAINFIRCGCPAAMLYSTYLTRIGSAEKLHEFNENIKKALRVLSPIEKFSSSASDDGSLVVFRYPDEKE